MSYVVRPEDIRPGARGARRPLSRSLESQLIALCARPAPGRIEALVIDNGAPATLAELLESTRGSVTIESESGAGSLVGVTSRRPSGAESLLGVRVPVWSGASSDTIWSSPAVNYLFRAWHDSHHIDIGADTDPEGEARVARYACSMIRGAAERSILWAEVWGQVAYYVAHGAFPDRQRRFVVDCIRFGVETTVARGLYHREEV